ncbi:hypothetical protein niasHS_005777 [Heterodera schachtii]|uniref:Uncharacterized protein n=2 Tax=Heterodera TaxID=34509 RepID=A0ABD2JZJ8_HETSC
MAAIGDEKERANFERLILNNDKFRGEMEEKEKSISNGQRKMEPNEIAELVEKHFKVMGEHKMEGEEEEKAETKKLGTDNLEKTKKTLNEFGNKVISADWKKLGKMRKMYYGIGNFKTDQQRFYELLTECISLLTGNDF